MQYNRYILQSSWILRRYLGQLYRLYAKRHDQEALASLLVRFIKKDFFLSQYVTFFRVSTIQAYTSLMACMLQFPILCIVALYRGIISSTADVEVTLSTLFMLFVFSGAAFYCQSVLTYGLMSIVSPVSHSVANTVKRSLLILLSIHHYGTTSTISNWIGLALVVSGVFGYNFAHQMVHQNEKKASEKLKRRNTCIV